MEGPQIPRVYPTGGIAGVLRSCRERQLRSRPPARRARIDSESPSEARRVLPIERARGTKAVAESSSSKRSHAVAAPASGVRNPRSAALRRRLPGRTRSTACAPASPRQWAAWERPGASTRSRRIWAARSRPSGACTGASPRRLLPAPSRILRSERAGRSRSRRPSSYGCAPRHAGKTRGRRSRRSTISAPSRGGQSRSDPPRPDRVHAALLGRPPVARPHVFVAAASVVRPP